MNTTREGLYSAIRVCRPGNCLSDIGEAIQNVADANNLATVEKYRGHGIGTTFHCAPYVKVSSLYSLTSKLQRDTQPSRYVRLIKHFRNSDRLKLQPGMIFTIEPMFTLGSARCFEWEDDWTVATIDGSLSAQFEHTILITDGEAEILTLPQ